MQKPEIRFLTTEDKISDFKLMLLLSDKIEIYDKETGEYLKDLDGKFLLIRFEKEDTQDRIQTEFYHQQYIDKICRQYYSFIKKGTNNVNIKKNKNKFRLMRLIILFPFEDILYFLIRLLKKGNVVTFYNFGEYSPTGEKLDRLYGVLFYTEKLSSMQRKSVRLLIKQLISENYKLDGVMIPRNSSLNYKEIFKKFEPELSYGELYFSNDSDNELLGNLYHTTYKTLSR